ncbi:hypothetical protein [Isoptericola rhizosphaerae]|uniref:hypothetical protein n=1 Tax=Isoptericola rhizosphaerae TaxID=3377837 RepID=UPI00383AB133
MTISGRCLPYCDRCRSDLSGRVAAAIPLVVADAHPESVMGLLYERGFTGSDPATVADLMNLSSNHWAATVGRGVDGPGGSTEHGAGVLTWEGALGPEELTESQVKARAALADAARRGAWDAVLRLLAEPGLLPHHWRLGGKSWFTPLHQAAWHGAAPTVVERLLTLGASRVLPAADGRTAEEIARQRGHHALADRLVPEVRNPLSRRAAQGLERRLAELVDRRIREVGLERRRLRPLPVVLLTEINRGQGIWWPVPGMHGGFDVRLEHTYLVVDSWSRMIEGSGQSHILTQESARMVARGFV